MPPEELHFTRTLAGTGRSLLDLAFARVDPAVDRVLLGAGPFRAPCGGSDGGGVGSGSGWVLSGSGRDGAPPAGFMRSDGPCGGGMGGSGGGMGGSGGGGMGGMGGSGTGDGGDHRNHAGDAASRRHRAPRPPSSLHVRRCRAGPGECAVCDAADATAAAAAEAEADGVLALSRPCTSITSSVGDRGRADAALLPASLLRSGSAPYAAATTAAPGAAASPVVAMTGGAGAAGVPPLPLSLQQDGQVQSPQWAAGPPRSPATGTASLSLSGQLQTRTAGAHGG
jgi:hypothetical protein